MNGDLKRHTGFRAMILIVVGLLPFVVGCSRFKDIVNGAESDAPKEVKAIGGPTPISNEAPEFNVTTPRGYTKIVFHGELPLDGVVHVQASAGAIADVFMKERLANMWFQIGPRYNEAFYYSFDVSSGTIRYIGKHLEWKEFCVYEYIKN